MESASAQPQPKRAHCLLHNYISTADNSISLPFTRTVRAPAQGYWGEYSRAACMPRPHPALREPSSPHSLLRAMQALAQAAVLRHSLRCSQRPAHPEDRGSSTCTAVHFHAGMCCLPPWELLTESPVRHSVRAPFPPGWLQSQAVLQASRQPSSNPQCSLPGVSQCC